MLSTDHNAAGISHESGDTYWSMMKTCTSLSFRDMYLTSSNESVINIVGANLP